MIIFYYRINTTNTIYIKVYVISTSVTHHCISSDDSSASSGNSVKESLGKGQSLADWVRPYLLLWLDLKKDL